MNKNRFASAAAVFVAALWLTGCAADRTKIPELTFREEVHALPVEHPLTEAEILERAASSPSEPAGGEGWRAINDGQWRVTDFNGHGQVEAQREFILLRPGDPWTGIHWTNETLTVNYEITLDAMRVSGADCFCELTFPVRDSFCALVVGGWGGSVVGLSSLDDLDASQNETTQIVSFERGRWYRIRLRVTEQKIEAWIEQKQVVDVVVSGRKVTLPPGDLELSRPLGLAAERTAAALRGIKIRRLVVPPSD